MKIVVGTNLLANVEPEIYSSHCAEYFTLGRDREITDVLQFAMKRMTIDRMRNEAAKIAMAQGFDWLVFVDDDMILTPNTLRALVKTDYDILMAHTHIRSYPFQPMSFLNKSTEEIPLNLFPFEDVLTSAGEDGISPCYAVGFACCAIRVELLKKMDPPYFVTGPANTEDIYFCVKAKQEIGEHVKIGVHTHYPTYHKVDTIYIGKDNLNQVKSFFDPEQGILASRDDRGTDYHERITCLDN